MIVLTFCSLRWTTTSVSVLPSDTKFLPALHAEKEVLVHRATPTSLSQDGMHLSSGALLPVSAVVYATGWIHTKSLFTTSETLDLGLPIPLSAEPASVAAHWNDLYSVADVQVCSLFPDLASPPPHVIKEPTHTPYRLHRQILSPNLLSRRDRRIVALGLTSSSQTATCSELSALWAVAWMEDLMPPSFPPPTEDLEMEVAMVNCWMWRRYLSSRGIGLPIIATEIQTVFDSLMRDMGLRVQRRRKGILGILREYLTPYKAADYGGVVQELLERVRKERETGDVAKKRV
jgi:dimethylaniline monooxygenase (N-oxide forming)